MFTNQAELFKELNRKLVLNYPDLANDALLLQAVQLSWEGQTREAAALLEACTGEASVQMKLTAVQMLLTSVRFFPLPEFQNYLYSKTFPWAQLYQISTRFQEVIILFHLWTSSNCLTVGSTCVLYLLKPKKFRVHNAYDYEDLMTWHGLNSSVVSFFFFVVQIHKKVYRKLFDPSNPVSTKQPLMPSTIIWLL